MTRPKSIADLSVENLSGSSWALNSSLDALKSEQFSNYQVLDARYRQLLNSRSWKWTSFLRTTYRYLVLRQKLAISSIFLNTFAALISKLTEGLKVILEFIGWFAIANFTLNGIRARTLKIKVNLAGDYPHALRSLEKSKFIRFGSLQSDVIFHITEDVYFSKFTIFEFSREWVKNGNNSTLYCDVINSETNFRFEKPQWDMIYNRTIQLFPPIYLESSKFSSLKPSKIQATATRPLCKLEFQRNMNFDSPRIPKISLSPVFKSNTPFSIVVPTANKRVLHFGEERWLIRDFIENVNKTQSNQVPEIIVVHNKEMSKKDQMALKSYPNVKLILCSQKTLNLSEKINVGVRVAMNENLIISNDDVRSKSSTWLDALLGWLAIDSVGVVGPRIFYENGFLQYAGVEVSQGKPAIIGYGRPGTSFGVGFSYVVPREVNAVTGVLMATRKSLFTKIGGWDTKLKINYNDIDFCLRMKMLGYKNVYEPRAQIFHLESASRDPGISHILEENFFISRHVGIQAHWPALVEDKAVSANLDFTWRQNYSV